MMDATTILEEYRRAQEEHAKALAEVKEMTQRLEAARQGYTDALRVEEQSARAVDQAADELAHGLEQALNIADREASPTSTSPLSLPPVSEYLIEYHANIGCYQCYVSVDDGGAFEDFDIAALRIDVDFPCVRVLTGAAPSKTWWSVEIERNVEASRCTIEKKVDHIYIRLPVKDSDRLVADGFTAFSQMTVEELDPTHYSNLCCRGCGSVLSREPPATLEKVLPLPSANWMEMLDFWGAGIGSFEHIPREGIFAHEGRVYVGEAHVLMHRSNLLESAVVDCPEQPANAESDDDSKDPDWVDLCCAKCAKVLGARHREQPTTWRLSKGQISSKHEGSDDRPDVFERYTIANEICATMLRSAESDGIFRFHLRPAETTGDAFSRLFVQLLIWDGTARSSRSAGFSRMLKVAYRPESSSNTAPTTCLHLPPMLRSQDLVLDAEANAEMLRRLQTSTRLLPESLRVFNKMNVGFLFI